MIQFLKETYSEMKTVSWPSRSKTINYTITVIVISMVVAYYLGFLDMIFSKVISYILSK